MSDDTFKQYGELCRYADSPSGVAVAAETAGQRIPISAYATGERLAAAGADGIRAMDLNRSDLNVLENVLGMTVRYDTMGTRAFLDTPMPPARFIERVLQDTTRKHSGIGVRGNISTPTFGR